MRQTAEYYQYYDQKLKNKVAVNPKIENYAKYYPDGTLKIYIYANEIERRDNNLDRSLINNDIPKTQEEIEEAELKSIRRTRCEVTDLILCNKWEDFATFTSNCRPCKQGCKNIKPTVSEADPKHENKPKIACTCDKATCKRYDIEYQRKRHSLWLENQKKQYGHFKHLSVMEYHKDGAPHFHDLFIGYKGKLTNSGRKKNGRIIYNLPAHPYGFTTLTKIQSIQKTSTYIQKYITKDMPKYDGKRRYWCSRGLLRDIKQENFPLNKINFKHRYGVVDKKSDELIMLIVTMKLDDGQEYKRLTPLEDAMRVIEKRLQKQRRYTPKIHRIPPLNNQTSDQQETATLKESISSVWPEAW